MAALSGLSSESRTLTKTRLIMRLIAVLPTIVLLNVHASGMGQSVTLSGKNVPMKKVLSSVEKQTGYFVFYDAELLSDAKPVSVEAKGMPLERFLDEIVRDQPFTYRIANKTISLVWRRMAADAPAVTAPPIVLEDRPVLALISGTVRGPDGRLQAGVSVMVKKTKKGTTTDRNGSFVIAAKQGDILVFSCIGFATQEIAVGKETSLGEIRMKAAVNELDKTVVIGYGTTSKRLNTGSVSTVDAADLEKQPVMNVLLALRGLVPGLVVTPTSGYASSPVKMLIRGRNNINTLVSSDPLVLIDGMPITTLNLDGTDQSNGANILPNLLRYGIGNTPTGGESPLFGLNPKDIESISVLKDADATAIYGSRGANGVILITTKRSRTRTTDYNVNVSEGISKVLRHYALTDVHQYVAMRREALMNDGYPVNEEFAPDLTVWDTTRNVDWQKALWGGTGKVTNVSTGISAGSGNTSFRLNGNFGRQTEILTISGGSQAINLAMSLDHHTNDGKFITSFSSVYTNGSTSEVAQSGQPMTLPPDAPPMYDSKGGLNYAAWAAAGLQLEGQFPFGSLLQRTKTNTNTLNTNLTLNYRPIKGLEAKVSIGYRSSQNLTQSTNPIAAQNPFNSYNPPTGTATFTGVESTGWIIEPQLNYALDHAGPGRLTILLGGSDQYSTSRYNVENGTGYTNDILLRSIINAPIIAAYDAYGQYKYAGVFGRVNYDIDNKYILNINGRRDGSSRFGPGKQFGNFGSVGGAWILSDEKWFQRILPSYVSFFKLRASYGVTGSDGVADYQYLTQWASGTISGLFPGYGGIARPLESQNAVNQNFHWQANKQLNEGLEIGFLDESRITLVLEHYLNSCSNQLLSYPTAAFTGFTKVTANWTADVHNEGWELTLNGKIIDQKDFTWGANMNISINKNKLASYPNIQNTPYYTTYLVGKSLSEAYLYHYLGVDPLTGQYAVEDMNHDGAISSGQGNYPPMSPANDNRVAINLAPKFTGGMTTNFTYKGMGLSLLFDFVRQMGKNAYYSIGLPGQALNNVPLEVYYNHWQKPGDHKQFAKFASGNSFNYGFITGAINFGASDGVYSDASFIRLSNLSFFYNLPAKTAKRMGMKGCNFYINTQNPFIFTKYKGVDPDLQSFAMPQPKIITGGVSLNF